MIIIRNLGKSSWTALFFFIALQFAHGFPARFGVGPDNNQELLISELNSAKKSILLNAYELNSEVITNIILKKIASKRPKVDVELIVEGEPTEQIRENAVAILKQIAEAMEARKNPKNHIWLMQAEELGRKWVRRNGKDKEVIIKGKRRYRFDHAKYTVIDGRKILTTSENFSATGHANPGMVGNRGWDVALESPELAQQMIQVFREDMTENPKHDIIEVTSKTDDKVFRKGEWHRKSWNEKARTLAAFPIEEGDVQEAELITSPEAVLGLIHVIGSAQKAIAVEDLSLPKTWVYQGFDEDSDKPEVARDRKIPNPYFMNDEKSRILNPIVQHLILAAEAGRQVRVLLNDDYAFGGYKPKGSEPLIKNAETAQYIHDYGYCKKITLDAKIINTAKTETTYIHNKGMVLDDDKAFVSSINGTRNSVHNNREVGVFMKSQDAARFYSQVFNFDWDNSDKLPNPKSCAHIQRIH